MSEADPQAKVLTELAGGVLPGVKIENVQMALTIFVALLLEIGSGFGMYVAFSQWRLYDVKAPAAPQMVAAVENTAAAAVAAPVLTPAAVQTKKPRSGANDNKSLDKPSTYLLSSPSTIEAQIAEVSGSLKFARSKPSRHRLRRNLRLRRIPNVSTRRMSRSRTDRVSLLLNSMRTIVRGVKPRTRNLLHFQALRVNSQTLASRRKKLQVEYGTLELH